MHLQSDHCSKKNECNSVKITSDSMFAATFYSVYAIKIKLP